ncbi:phosphotransferase family protein [Pseudidiomarina sediminum]|uniref:Phosphotransferase family protein n=1 Tax=Pseudidiomarina sediminum TaxID=431675 RepID=A0A432Z3V3_9GAMM|nr:phosphotransferase [Pseudidiomarina sediminum]RUO72513.1 phosphotransferase family protein [Pseudidiomarina sediminum]
MTSANHLELDNARLASYLEQHIDGFKGPISSEKFADGQSNPTYLIKSSNARYVLRRQPPGELLKSAHAVDREYRVISALGKTAVPVAKTYHLCLDATVIGNIFYVMEFIDAQVFWDPSLATLDNHQRRAVYHEMNRVLAALHSVDIDAVQLSDYGRPSNYFERQVARWTRQYRAAETEVIPEMEALIDWLPQNLPEDDGRVAIAHGDFRLDNMMFDKESLQVVALLDWELSTLGHPFADLAYQCMQLRMPHGGLLSGLGGLDRAALGIPSEEEYVAEYCQRMNISHIPHWNYYLAFSFFRLASILQGVKKRAIEGNSSNKNAHQMGEQIKPLVQLAVSLLDEPQQ